MGSSSPKIKPKENKIIEEKIEESKNDETEEIEEINIIVEKSEKEKLEEQQKEEERRREEEERKKEELKRSILQKIKEEEIIIKIKFTNEEFTNYIVKFFEEFIQIFNSLQKKNAFISLIFEFNKKYIYSFNNKDYPDIPLKQNFFEALKYSTLMIVCF